ncbi:MULTISPECIES: universal stress protein [Streptomyces]|uniref:universal stress protein n=1 Tax=Streptomyces TaxID=1883 RepID=UPI00278C632F|nr:universal stress protein [Streptomyces hydrogenans]
MAAVQRLPRLGPVVVGVDGSESALSAVLRAAEEALLRGSGLFPVHATGPDALARYPFQAEIDESRRTGRELLDLTAATVSARHPDVLVVKELGDRPPSEALRHAAALSGTIVVGHRGPDHPGPTPGRTTLALLRHAHCPVELVPRHGPGHGSTS